MSTKLFSHFKHQNAAWSHALGAATNFREGQQPCKPPREHCINLCFWMIKAKGGIAGLAICLLARLARMVRQRLEKSYQFGQEVINRSSIIGKLFRILSCCNLSFHFQNLLCHAPLALRSQGCQLSMGVLLGSAHVPSLREKGEDLRFPYAFLASKSQEWTLEAHVNYMNIAFIADLHASVV